MEIDFSDRQITLDKELNDLDKLVIDFVNVLDKSNINYVLISGYVAILFGRSRSSEDIDVIVERMSEERFLALSVELAKSFDCIITENPKDAYDTYLSQRASIRFARKGEFVPNMEFMFPKAPDLDNWVLANRIEVILNGISLKISPIELQIPYKLFLGSSKDIEDARHLYMLFKDRLDKGLLTQFLIKLDKEGRFNKYLT
ncbi:MAG: hypothetical protein HRF40_12085 [Nitrososphaera sp.]